MVLGSRALTTLRRSVSIPRFCEVSATRGELLPALTARNGTSFAGNLPGSSPVLSSLCGEVAWQSNVPALRGVPRPVVSIAEKGFPYGRDAHLLSVRPAALPRSWIMEIHCCVGTALPRMSSTAPTLSARLLVGYWASPSVPSLGRSSTGIRNLERYSFSSLFTRWGSPSWAARLGS